MSSPNEQAIFDWLDELRDSGECNMMEAPKLLREQWEMTKAESFATFERWTDYHNGGSEAGPTEIEKNAEHIEHIRAIMDFIEWVGHDQGCHLLQWRERPDPLGGTVGSYVTLPKSLLHLVYEYYDIDPQKLEEERRALLDQAAQAHREGDS